MARWWWWYCSSLFIITKSHKEIAKRRRWRCNKRFRVQQAFTFTVCHFYFWSYIVFHQLTMLTLSSNLRRRSMQMTMLLHFFEQPSALSDLPKHCQANVSIFRRFPNSLFVKITAKLPQKRYLFLSFSHQNKIRFIQFHRSEPQFLTLDHQNYIHIYRIEKNEPVCVKVLHLSNFIVHQARWTSKNTCALSPSLMQTPPDLEEPRVYALLWYRARCLLADLQHPWCGLWAVLTCRLSGDEERCAVHFSRRSDRPSDQFPRVHSDGGLEDTPYHEYEAAGVVSLRCQLLRQLHLLPPHKYTPIPAVMCRRQYDLWVWHTNKHNPHELLGQGSVRWSGSDSERELHGSWVSLGGGDWGVEMPRESCRCTIHQPSWTQRLPKRVTEQSSHWR